LERACSLLPGEQILEAGHVALQATYLTDGADHALPFAGAAAAPCGRGAHAFGHHDQVDRLGDRGPHAGQGRRVITTQAQLFQAGKGGAGVAGVQRGERATVTSGHGVDHVQGGPVEHLADHHVVRAQAQAKAHQGAGRDAALSMVDATPMWAWFAHRFLPLGLHVRPDMGPTSPQHMPR